MQLTSFENYPSRISPLQLYACLYPVLKEQDQAWYASGSITSGGARLNPNWPLEEVIALNTIFAQKLVAELGRNSALQCLDVTLPHLIGKKINIGGSPWRESDYLPFWVSVMFRLEPELAEVYWLDVVSKLNTKVMNDHYAARADRIEQYRQMEQATVAFLRSHRGQQNPVSGVIRLPGSKKSLGSTLEQRVAIQRRIPVRQVVLNTDHPQFKESDLARDPVLKLLQGVNEIVQVRTSFVAALHPVLGILQYQP